MSPSAYPDPHALRSAIADRLRPLARERSVQLTDLQRQFAYDRLLCRVFSHDPDRWVLKGGTAMLARHGSDARHTRDVDLLSRTGDLHEAEQALRVAAGLDLDDYFAFTLSPGRRIAQGAGALRVRVQADLGLREFARFHVDLVANLTMTGAPDPVMPLVPVQIPGLSGTNYMAYPLVDHIADKVHGLLETHARASGLSEPSTRYRDLVDLAVFAHTASIDARELESALVSEAARRGIVLPRRVTVPTSGAWSQGYARIARDLPSLPERDLKAALATVGRFIDPVLDGRAQGHWDHAKLQWDASETTERAGS